MSSLFIIGNGFDIAHGIQTAYRDFRKYIIDLYPDSLLFRDNTVSIEEYGDLPIDEVAAETLLYAMDHASGEDWNDFEDALSRIHFYDKLPGYSSERHKEGTLEHQQEVTQFLMIAGMISGALAESASACWQEFFSSWIKTIEHTLENSAIKPHSNLISLFGDPDAKFMSFNYTKTLQHVYGVKVVKHIHNRVGQKLIFGHGCDDPWYFEPEGNRPSFASSELEDFIASLRKDTNKQLRKYSDFFRKLGLEIDKVYSYGFSYAKVDSPYIKEVVRRISPYATWYFTEHEAKNKKELGKKKSKLRRYGFNGEIRVFQG